jgi:hypothetical protein
MNDVVSSLRFAFFAAPADVGGATAYAALSQASGCSPRAGEDRSIGQKDDGGGVNDQQVYDLEFSRKKFGALNLSPPSAGEERDSGERTMGVGSVIDTSAEEIFRAQDPNPPRGDASFHLRKRTMGWD